MTVDLTAELASTSQRRRDFRLFLTSQAISNLGSSFTLFGLPLLVFTLTGSAVNLALTTVAGFLPYFLFGLAIGVWVDRVDRRRAMLAADVFRGLVIGTVPVLAATGSLTVWWVYGVAFVSTTISIMSSGIEGAAIPSLVPADELADANGKLRGSYAGAQVIGPLLAGALIGGGLPVSGVFAVDAGSFGVSAALLFFVRTKFNVLRASARQSVFAEIVLGLRYVLSHPVLRNIALHAALYNLIAGTVTTELVLFAHDRLKATDAQVSLLFAAGALGTAVALFTTGRLGSRISFRMATLGAVTCWSLLVLALAFSTDIWMAAVLWTAAAGLPSVYGVRTLTLRQAIVPDHLLGRAQTTASVLSWSAQPIGALIGAAVINVTGQISLVYAGIALLVTVMNGCFWWGPLGRLKGAELTTGGPVQPVSGVTLDEGPGSS
jgi:MFS family permease